MSLNIRTSLATDAIVDDDRELMEYLRPRMSSGEITVVELSELHGHTTAMRIAEHADMDAYQHMVEDVLGTCGQYAQEIMLRLEESGTGLPEGIRENVIHIARKIIEEVDGV